LAVAVDAFAGAGHAWRGAWAGHASDGERVAGSDPEFRAAVELAGGWLPGSAQLSAAASLGVPPLWSRQPPLPLHVRTSIQTAIAGSVAVVIGHVVSPGHAPWAALATFVTFLGTNDTLEQFRKGTLRIGGTLAGGVLGGWLVHLTGTRLDVAVIVVLCALFLAFYLFRVNYAYSVAGLTIVLAQLYSQLGEYAVSLLVIRLAETAVGAIVAIATALWVLPLPNRYVAREALGEFLQALTDCVASTMECGQSSTPAANLRARVRDVDARYHALLTANAAARMPFSGAGPQRLRVVGAAATARHAVHTLAPFPARGAELPAPVDTDLETGRRLLTASLREMTAGVRENDATVRVYTSPAPLLARAALRARGAGTTGAPAEAATAAEELTALDAALVGVAESLGMPVQVAEPHTASD
jgi:uncharacterized membrane protein YccC